LFPGHKEEGTRLIPRPLGGGNKARSQATKRREQGLFPGHKEEGTRLVPRPLGEREQGSFSDH